MTTVVCAALLCFGLSVFAVDIMPIDQIKIGMQGVAKTVVYGSRIDEFNVEVLGVLKGKGPSGDLILVRTSGALIDQTGGIAEGMSGSPVYINGKLVGAVAYGWGFADHKIGMLTYIGDMLKILDFPDTVRPAVKEPEQPGISDADFNKNIEDMIAKIRAQLKNNNNESDTTIVVNPKMKLFTGGFSDQAVKTLQKRLNDFEIVNYSASDLPSGVVLSPLKPGATIGAELVRGDTTMGALGTVTYVDGNKVLAFGHPFLKKGAVDLIMTNGYIFQVVNSLDSAFKMGVAGEPVGIINQDRGAGIAGKIGSFPGVVPLTVSIDDKTSKRKQKYYAQTIIDETLTPELQSQSVVSFVDKTMDRVGQGSAKVTYQITARYMPGVEIKRTNMFYSDKNISAECVGELRELLAELTANRFNPVEILEVDVTVEVTEDKLLTAIIEATAEKTDVHAGDKINIEVTTRPYRGEVIKQTIAYTIPKDQKPGEMMLEVRGGSQQTLAEMINSQQQLANADLLQVLKLTRIKDTSFEEALKEMLASDCNNEIVVERLDFPSEMMQQRNANSSVTATEAGSKMANLLTFTSNNPTSLMSYASSPSGDKPSTAPKDKKQPQEQTKFKLTTDYIVIGDTQVVVNVLPKAK
ncbi:MAG: SpoIVB peptidase S55 domain-containing protein [Bacillota bacterium]